MKVSVISLSDSELKILVEGEGNTLLNALRDLLFDDEKVVFASYTIEHPMRSVPRLTLRTKDKSAISTLIEASAKLASLAEEFNKKFTNLVETQK
ncbi:MAG: DNA-directed RNA polymerase subunit L [Candidatus Atabeyarchaeum deiterrae]